MRALVLLLILAGCAAHDYSDFTFSSDPSLAAAIRRAEIRFAATVTSHERLSGDGICPRAPGERCEVYRLALSEASRALPCPLIAISYFDDNGHGYFSWNPTIMNRGTGRWRIRAVRVPRPHCHYTLQAASPVGA